MRQAGQKTTPSWLQTSEVHVEEASDFYSISSFQPFSSPLPTMALMYILSIPGNTTGVTVGYTLGLMPSSAAEFFLHDLWHLGHVIPPQGPTFPSYKIKERVRLSSL